MTLRAKPTNQRATRDIRTFFCAQPLAKKYRTTLKGVDSDKPEVTATKTKGSKIEALTGGTNKEDVEQLEQGREQIDGVVVCKMSFAKLRTLVQLRSLMHQSWFDLLQKEFARDSFQTLTRFLEAEDGKKSIYPPPAEVFAALRDYAFADLKVVILGQDPYHGPQQAHGLSFSVRRGVPPPPSLRNIFKEAMNDVGIDRPAHGCLTCWSRQGVLLLNAVLTVRQGEPNSHKKRGWEQFTDAIISTINTDASNVVFMLWGKPAQEKSALIDAKRHLVVRCSHPSPLGATKTSTPFLGSKCFSRANTYLVEHGKAPVDWSVR